MLRSMDDELNNTSLILLFEIGGKKLLFPGDTQWENWEYALSNNPSATSWPISTSTKLDTMAA